MSKVRTYGVVFLALLLVWLTACIRDTVVEDDLQPAHVRVQTTVKIGFEQPTTRAWGDWEEGKYHPETSNKGDPFDSKIASMRILAFSEGVLKANKLYNSGVSYVDGNTYYSQFGKKIEGTDTTYYMDMELLPGLYRFYLIANENDLWTPGLSALQLETSRIDDMFAIQSMQVTNNNIFSAYWYRYLPVENFTEWGNISFPTEEPKGIPMVGVAGLNIIADPNATEGSPTLINPSIDLKRTLAKLEVYLKNTDDYGVLYPDAAHYRFKNVVLRGSNREYNVFNKEYNPSAAIPLGSSGLSIPIPVHTYDGTTVTPHTAGTPYNNKAFFSYLAEYNYNTAEYPYPLSFVVNTEKLGETITYEIPIYRRIDPSNPSSTIDYSIKRNYLYRIYCTLQGSGIIQVKYAVGDWEFKNLETVLGYGFQLVLDGNQLTITNTMQACAPHSIRLEAKNGATVDGVATATFAEFVNGYSKTFAIANVPTNTNIEYLDVYYNDELIKTFITK